MKTVFTILSLFIASTFVSAVSVKLKITYKGSGLSGHKVTILAGGSSLGSGVTDGSGNVSISVSSLPSKRIDLKGEKKCDNAQKSWEANGYVTLDDNYSGELKLDELIKMMSEGSGGFLSEESLAKSYGCICAGTSEDGNNENTGSDASTEDKGISTINKIADAKQQREEQLSSKRQMYEQKLQNLDYKIEKKNKKLGEYDEKEKQEALYEIREWQIEKELAQNELDRINMQMSKKTMVLNKEEKEVYDDKEEVLKEDLDALKADKKAGKILTEEMVMANTVVEKKEEVKNEIVKEDVKVNNKKEEEVEKEEEDKDDDDDEKVEKKEEVKQKSKKEIEREEKQKEELAKEEAKRKAEELEKQKEADKLAEKERLKKEEEEKKLAEEEKAKAEEAAREDLVYTPEEFANMSKGDLGKERFKLSTELSKLDIKLSTRKNSMTPNELAEAEARKLKLEEAIKSIEAEQEKRKAEKE